MAYKFNPFTDTLDIVGSGGGSYIDGEVEYHSSLPVTVGTPAVNSAFLVRKGEGLYFISRKPAGIWVRELNNGNLDDWKYAGTFSDIYRDANFRIINDADTSKQLAFSLSGLTTGTTSTLTVPAASGTIARTEDFASPPAIGNTTRNTGAFTTLSATGQATFSDQITGANATATPPTTTTAAKGLQFALLGGSTGNTAAIYGSHGGTSTLGIGIANGSAGSITQVAAFTSSGLSVNGGTVTASAPVLDLSQTWNNSGVTFTGLRLNATNTASAAASLLADLRVGGTSRFSISASGAATAVSFNSPSNANLILNTRGVRVFEWDTSAGYFYTNLRADGRTIFNLGAILLNWPAGGTLVAGGTNGVIDQRSGASPQAFQIYTTYTSETSFERLSLRGQTTNNFIIATEKGTTGGAARGLELRTDSVTRLTLGDAGGVTIADANNIAVGTTTGTKIGTGTTQKIGFFNATPVVQQAAIADATDAATTQARLNDLLATMRTLGLIAT